MAETADILIVGGGALGLLSARELALGGARVTLLERGVTGHESSWAGGGIVSPLHPWRYGEAVTALAAWGQARYRDACAAMAESSGIDPEWTRSGLLILESAERGPALAWAAAHGVEMLEVEGAALGEIEPTIAPGLTHGLWMPQVAQVRNPRLMQALRGDAPCHGVEIREHTEVTGFLIQGGRVHGVQTPSGAIHAGQVLVAGGAWSAGLLEELGAEVAVKPARGQMVLYRTAPGTVTRIVLHEGHYIIPRRDGRVLAGSTLEYVGFDKSTTYEALEQLRRDAVKLIPALAAAPVEHHWAGLRPSSLSGIPYIGEHPRVKGLFVNTGHFRNGVVLGLASARLAADLMLAREPIVDPSPYALAAPRGDERF